MEARLPVSSLQNPDWRIVLASASEARARLLRAAGVDVVLRPVPVDEALVREGLRADGIGGAEAAVALATLKAQRIAADAARDELVVAGDQLLETAAGEWPDKPADAAALQAQLSRLIGARHTLHTAAVLYRGGARVWHHVASPKVTLRPVSEGFIERYLAAAGPDLVGCAGAYRVEGLGAHLIARIDGDLFAVQGLPLLPLLAALREQGALAAD